MKATVRIQGVEKVSTELAKQRREALQESLEWLKTAARKDAPTATGKYKGEYRYRTFATKNGRLGEFYNDLEYASYASNGRGKGRMPPDEAIRAWVRTKGIPESAVYPIRKKIAEKGTKQHQAKKSHIGIDYGGNIIRGGLVDQANRKFEALIDKFRAV